MLYNCQPLFIHIRLHNIERLFTNNAHNDNLLWLSTYSDSINEFFIGDVSISVLVEVVVNAGQLLSGHETSKLGAHFLKLQLVQGARSVYVVQLLSD